MITGDIDAMWLRDSSAQVYPYLDFMSEDKKLQNLIAGVINKQVTFILKDPYANAFHDDDTKYTRWASDHTEMNLVFMSVNMSWIHFVIRFVWHMDIGRRVVIALHLMRNGKNQ